MLEWLLTGNGIKIIKASRVEAMQYMEVWDEKSVLSPEWYYISDL